jgi:hypothetical protein
MGFVVVINPLELTLPLPGLRNGSATDDGLVAQEMTNSKQEKKQSRHLSYVTRNRRCVSRCVFGAKSVV